MFCRKCGKEVQEDWATCPNCGNPIHQNATANMAENKTPQNTMSSGKKKEKKKPIRKIIIALFAIIAIGCIFAAMSGGNDSDNEEASGDMNSKETIEKLQKFTTMTKDGDVYIFSNGENWELHYTTGNEFVVITEPEVLDCFAVAFNSSEIGNSGTFTYDLDENEARMYFDYDSEADDKKISTINYDIEKNQYTALADGERYDISEDLQNHLDEYKLSDIIKKDVEAFKEDLENQGLTFNDVEGLTYDDIVSYEK